VSHDIDDKQLPLYHTRHIYIDILALFYHIC